MLLFLIDKLASSIVAFPLIALFLFSADKERFSRKWIWVLLFAVYMNAMLIPFGVFLPVYFAKFRKLLPTVVFYWCVDCPQG